MKRLTLFLLLAPLLSFAQEGINFEHLRSWKEVVAKAKAENKYIFVDAFTTWCGPCTYMSKNIFPQKKVGDFFNKNFINVKVQLDTTSKDNEFVKQWYADGHYLMNEYKVNAFPTFLYFEPSGNIVHRTIGGSEADEFIARGVDALDADKQYYTMLAKYNEGKKDPDFLRKLAYLCNDAYDLENAEKISNQYIETQTNLFTKENLAFLDRFTTSVKSKGFGLLLKYGEAYDAVIGKGSAVKKISQIIFVDEIVPKVFVRGASAPDWNELRSDLSSKYPLYSDELIAITKVQYYQNLQDWKNFEPAVIDFVKKYGSNLSPTELNEYAWNIFEHSGNKNSLTEALGWSKRSLYPVEKPMFIDTYANILYKLGKKVEALSWQNKAIAMVGDAEKSDYQETLEKMKKGEKTWKD